MQGDFGNQNQDMTAFRSIRVRALISVHHLSNNTIDLHIKTIFLIYSVSQSVIANICEQTTNFFYKSSAFWSFFSEIVLESFGCGLYTSAAYTRVFTVLFDYLEALNFIYSQAKDIRVPSEDHFCNFKNCRYNALESLQLHIKHI